MPFGAIWRHWEPFVAIWSHLEQFGPSWTQLELFRVIFSHFEKFGPIKTIFFGTYEPYIDFMDNGHQVPRLDLRPEVRLG